MPIYGYFCKSCNCTFEIETTISKRDDVTKEPCPTCHQKTIERDYGCGNTVAIGDPVKLGIRKAPSVLRDRLKEIKKRFPQPKGIFK